jgi:hypothetical protein
MRGNNGLGKSLRADFTGAYDALYDIWDTSEVELRNSLEEIGKMGAEYMQNLIATRSTGWGEFMRSQGLGHGPGRNRTGQMSSDIMYRAEVGQKKQYVRVGWLKNYEDYYGYQETGFRNYGRWNPPLDTTQPFIGKSWQWTEGMFALFDTRVYVKGLRDAEVAGMAKRIANNVNGRKR